MAEDQALAAMHRIDAALARIEDEVDQLYAANEPSVAHAQIAAEHARLRDGIRAMIAGLDRMIAGEASGAN